MSSCVILSFLTADLVLQGDQNAEKLEVGWDAMTGKLSYFRVELSLQPLVYVEESIMKKGPSFEYTGSGFFNIYKISLFAPGIVHNRLLTRLFKVGGI